MMTTHEDCHHRSLWRSPIVMGIVAVLGITGVYYVTTEHWQHTWTFLPYLLLLACPLMHLFMHGGHGGHGGHGRAEQVSRAPESDTRPR